MKDDRQNVISICALKESARTEKAVGESDSMRGIFDDEIGCSGERQIKRLNSDMEKEMREAVLISC